MCNFKTRQLVAAPAFEPRVDRDDKPSIRYRHFTIQATKVDVHSIRLSEKVFESLDNRYGWPTFTINGHSWTPEVEKLLPMSVFGDSELLNLAGTKIVSLRSGVSGVPRYSVTENEVLLHFDHVPAGVADYTVNVSVPYRSDLGCEVTQAGAEWLEPCQVNGFTYDRITDGLHPAMAKVLASLSIYQGNFAELDWYGWNQWGPKRSKIVELPMDQFVLTAERKFRCPEVRYRLEILSNDGIQVLIDGWIVLSDWRGSLSNFVWSEAELAKGEHRIQVEYFEIDTLNQLAVYFRRVE